MILETVIISLSILLQLAAIVLVLRIASNSHHKAVFYFVAVGLVMMVARRTYSIIFLLMDLEPMVRQNVYFDLLGLLASAIILWALYQVTPLVSEILRLDIRSKQRGAILHTMFDTLPDPSFFKDDELRYQWVNPAFTKELNINEHNVLGKTDEDIFPEKYAQSYREDDLKILQYGIETSKDTLYLSQNLEKWYYAKKTPARDSRGNVIGILTTLTDVSVRRKREENVISERDLTQYYLDTSGSLLIILDDQCRISLINNATNEILGYPERELISTNFLNRLVPFQYKQIVQKQFKSRLFGKTDMVDNVEFPLFTRDGTLRHILWRNRYYIDKTKNISGYICSGIDVTDRKMAEEAQNISENRYRQVFLNSEAMQMMIDPATGMILQANSAVSKNMGYKIKDLEKMKLTDILVLDMREVLQELSDVRSERIRYSQTRYHRANGDLRDIEIHWSTIQIKTNVILNAIIHDVTDRIQAEEQVHRSNKLFHGIVEQMTDGMTIIDEKLRVLEWNPGMEKITGINRRNAIGQFITDLRYATLKDKSERKDIYTENMESKLLEELKEDNPEWNNRVQEVQILNTKGIERIVHQLSFLMDIGKEKLICSIIRDVTDMKQAEESAIATSRLEATATLAGGMAHDINNLMAAVMGNAELLQLESVNDDQSINMLRNIITSAQRASQISDQLLAYARQGQYYPKPIDINTIIRAIDNTEILNKAENITLHVDLHEKLPKILADIGQLKQMILNLYHNAAEALEGFGNISIKTRRAYLIPDTDLSEEQFRPGTYVQIIIEDDGGGMSNEVKERIFEPFFSTKLTGRGLGLSAVYGIVKNHHGMIEVASSPDQGTRFDIFLPTISEEMLDDRTIQSEDIIAGQGNILLVDDDLNITKTVRKLLIHLGYTVTTASNGKEAIEKIETNPPFDLIILDIKMPVMSGDEAIPILQRQSPGSRILICSGQETQNLSENLLSTGSVAGILKKPFTLSMLSRALHKSLKEKDFVS